MKKSTRKPDRAAVAKSMRELELLFGGIKPPAGKGKGLREQAFGEAGKQKTRGATT